MSDNEKLEDFLLCILESQEFDKVSYIFFNIIKIIGPIKSPNTPVNLNPVYIAINVKIG